MFEFLYQTDSPLATDGLIFKVYGAANYGKTS